MVKRGQVSIWVIITAIFVGLIVLIFSLNKNSVEEDNYPQLFDVKSFVSQCTENYVKEAVDIMLFQGGFITHKNTISYSGKNIEYLCDNIGYYDRCINHHPVLLEEMKEEIREYLRSKLVDCFQDLQTASVENNIQIEFGSDFDVDINWGDDRINVYIEKGIILKKDARVARLRDFNFEITNPAYNLASLAERITDGSALSCDFNYEELTAVYPRFSIDTNEKPDSTRVYNIRDLKSGEEMNIAIRGCVKPDHGELFSELSDLDSYDKIIANWENCLEREECSGDLASIMIFLEKEALNIISESEKETISNFIESSEGVKTCLKSKEDKMCQQYLGNVCGEKCASEGGCINVDLTKTSLPLNSDCKLGICYDETENTCMANSPRAVCLSSGGSWDLFVDREKCEVGCCILKEDFIFTIRPECEALAFSSKTDLKFDTTITEESDCSPEGVKKGSCIYYEERDVYCYDKISLRECQTYNGEFSLENPCEVPEGATITAQLESLDSLRAIFPNLFD